LLGGRWLGGVSGGSGKSVGLGLDVRNSGFTMGIAGRFGAGEADGAGFLSHGSHSGADSSLRFTSEADFAACLAIANK